VDGGERRELDGSGVQPVERGVTVGVEVGDREVGRVAVVSRRLNAVLVQGIEGVPPEVFQVG
jgi:hypothetical protein